MSTKKIVLLCGLLLFLAMPVIAYQYWEELLQLMGVQGKVESAPQPAVELPPATSFLSPRTQEQVELLQKQSLDESFAHLLNDQQYFGYISPYGTRFNDLEVILSTRNFLKVFQQFGKLPREQALEKLRQFSDRAIQEFEDSLDKSLVRNAAQAENIQKGNPLLPPSELFKLTGTHGPSLMGTKYMMCVAMLLAARMGEKELLLEQLDTMQSLTDQYIEGGGYSRRVASLEDDCIISILIHALTQTEEELDFDFSPFVLIPDGKTATTRLSLTYKTIPLYRWDAYVTYYDSIGIADPNDIVDEITVYRTHVAGDIGDPQVQHLIEALRERLAN